MAKRKSAATPATASAPESAPAPALDANMLREALAPIVSQLVDTVKTTAAATNELSQAMESAIDQQQRQITDLARQIEAIGKNGNSNGNGHARQQNWFDDLKTRMEELQSLKSLLGGGGNDTEKLLAEIRRMQEEFKRGFEEGRDRGKLEAQVEAGGGMWGALTRIAERIPPTALEKLAMAPAGAMTAGAGGGALGTGNALKEKRQQLKQAMIQRKNEDAATKVFLEVCGLVEYLAANMHSPMGPAEYAAWAKQQLSPAALDYLAKTPWNELEQVMDSAIKHKLSPAGLGALPADIRASLGDFFAEFQSLLQ